MSEVSILAATRLKLSSAATVGMRYRSDKRTIAPFEAGKETVRGWDQEEVLRREG